MATSKRVPGTLLRQLEQALVDAFDIAGFDRMLRFELDVMRETIATGSLTNIVFETVMRFEREGRLSELIRGARTSNPGNVMLQQVEAAFAALPAETDTSVRPEGDIVPDLNDLVDAFAATDTMSRSGDRDDVVAELRPEIRDRIRRRSSARSDIRNIVKKSLEFDSGLLELVEVVREFEGDTDAMQALEQLIAGDDADEPAV